MQFRSKGPDVLMQLPNSFIWKQKSFENINSLSTEYLNEAFQFQKVNIFSQCYLPKQNLQLSFKTGLNAKGKNKEKGKGNKAGKNPKCLFLGNIIIWAFFPTFLLHYKNKVLLWPDFIFSNKKIGHWSKNLMTFLLLIRSSNNRAKRSFAFYQI